MYSCVGFTMWGWKGKEKHQDTRHTMDSDSVAEETTPLSFSDADLENFNKCIKAIIELMKLKKQESKKSKKHVTPETMRYTKEVTGECSSLSDRLQKFFPTQGSKEATKLAVETLKVLGSAHAIGVGLILVAKLVETLSELDTVEEEYFSLLEQLAILVDFLQQIKQNESFRNSKMATLVEQSFHKIKEIYSLYQKHSHKTDFQKWASLSTSKKTLLKLVKDVKDIHKNLGLQLQIVAAHMMAGIYCEKINQSGRISFDRVYPQRAVGVRNRVNEVSELLQLESDVRGVAVVIYGIGGLGKSTLAQAVVSSEQVSSYKYAKIQLSEDNNIVMLQNQILNDLGYNLHDTCIGNYEDGQEKLLQVFRKVPSFIYIDNVVSREELERLLPGDMTQVLKLRILLTTRDANISSTLAVHTEKYCMPHLDDESAKSFLCQRLPENCAASLGDNKLNKLVGICGGVPEIISQVGGYFRGRKEPDKAYKIILECHKKLQGIAFGNLDKVLGLDCLDNEHFDAFLDICCFFKSFSWHNIEHILGLAVVDKLQSKGIVHLNASGEETLEIREVLYDFGLKKSKGKRLTTREELEDILDSDMSDNEIEEMDIKGILLSGGSCNDGLEKDATLINAMRNSLRVLKISPFTLNLKGTCNKKLGKLLYFNCTDNTVTIPMSKVPSLTFLSTTFSTLKEKETLYQILSKVPKNLYCFALEDCTDSEEQGFEVMGNDILERLENLRSFVLKGLSSLKHIPENIGVLQYLSIVSIERCISLEVLPPSLCELSQLHTVSLQGCKMLQNLPERFSELTGLVSVNLSGCSKIQRLPRGFGRLSSLKVLNLRGCEKLVELCTDFSNLSSLERLDLSSCVKMEGQSMRHVLKMKTLKHCDISNSSMLREAWRRRKLGEYFSSLPMLVVVT